MIRLASLITSNIGYSTNFEESNQKMKVVDYMVAFSGKSKSYCVGVVDMVDSTKMASILGASKLAKYYGIFLNSMSKIIGRFGGSVLKNIGDCLVYYFPESSIIHRKFGFFSCLECNLTMIENHEAICKMLRREGLPNVDYRISSDYGSVVLMKANNSSLVDMIGPPINLCSKINHAAETNGMVVGGDLYSIVKGYADYRFKEIKGYSLGFKHAYPIYKVHRR